MGCTWVEGPGEEGSAPGLTVGVGGRSTTSLLAKTAILLCLSAKVGNAFFPPASRDEEIGVNKSLDFCSGSVIVVRALVLISGVLIDLD